MFTWIDSESLKIVSAISMFIGTLLVSWRVTVILSALSFAVSVMDANVQLDAAKFQGSDVPIVKMYGFHGRVANAERLGIKLLIAGFAMQLIGVACNILSFLV
jgi:hypothetical protein